MIGWCKYLIQTIEAYMWKTDFRLWGEIQHTHPTVALE